MAPRLRLFYGGTFDPVHAGHLGIARAARDACDADLWFVPAADPPHKRARADGAQRSAMLELAIAARRRLHVDRREFARAGASYTVDTLRELRAEAGPDAPLAWLVGGDSLRQLDSWHQWRALFGLAHLLVAERPDAAGGRVPLVDAAPAVAAEVAPRLCAPAELHAAAAGRVAILPLPVPFPQSSTAIRAAIAAGDPGWRAQLPEAVAAYIDRHRLYARVDGA